MSGGSARRTRTPSSRRPACSSWPTAWAATAVVRSRPGWRPRRCSRVSGRRSIPVRPTSSSRAVQRANEAVVGAASEDPDLAGMGTTLCAMALVKDGDDERLAIVNVGDSRAYLLKSGELEQITDDHSLVATLERQGRLTARRGGRAPAAQHPHPRARHRRAGHGRLLGGPTGRRGPVRALQRRTVQRGRREQDRRHAAQAGRPDRSRPRARPPGQRRRRSRQHQPRDRRRRRRRRDRRSRRRGRRIRSSDRRRVGRGPRHRARAWRQPRASRADRPPAAGPATGDGAAEPGTAPSRGGCCCSSSR